MLVSYLQFACKLCKAFQTQLCRVFRMLAPNGMTFEQLTNTQQFLQINLICYDKRYIQKFCPFAMQRLHTPMYADIPKPLLGGQTS